MSPTIDTPKTPISGKVDRRDERVRVIEEAVLMMRGEWPAAASGLCETVNRATGVFAPAGELSAAIEEASAEAERLIERLYGHDALLEVRDLAGVEERSRAPHTATARRRLRAPSAPRRRAHTALG